MKTLTKIIVLAAIAALPLTFMNAQTEKPVANKTHRTVFEVTMEGSEQWTAVLNNVENVRTALGPATEIEVVAHSKGLGMLVAKDNPLAGRMKTLADGASFSPLVKTR